MAFDGAYLYAVKQEIETLVGSRADKIHQPSRDEIVIHLRGRDGMQKLLISTAGDSARIHLTEVAIENPAVPPMFCMLLRKHLGGGKLLSVRQDGLERILFLDFECVNELGDHVQLTLACEVMGRYSNCILMSEDGNIIDSLKRNADVTRERVILPGFPYEMPHRSRRLNFMDTDDDTIISAILLAADMPLDKALVQIFEGVSPLLAREWAYYVGKADTIRTHAMTQVHRERLLFALHRTAHMLKMQECRFSILQTPEGQLKDYCFLRPEQYGALMVVRPMTSASAALDEFYAKRDLHARMKQRANDLFRLVMTRLERVSRKLANQRAELAETDRMEQNKLYGDLLSANLYRIQKGDTAAVVENFYDENLTQITIPLQVNLTPAQNAQRYYTLYRKAATAKEKLAEQIAQGEQELLYLESVFDVLSRAESEADLLLLREELYEQGYSKKRNPKQKPPKQQPPMVYRSEDGFMILVGRNNRQNDLLTTKQAAKQDIWLHTQNIPGSHVILVTDGVEPSETAIRQAAVLAAYHSKARDSAQVPVDFCKVKFVKKPSGAKPGMVIFTNQQTIYVKPDASLCEKLAQNV
ncbi:MAG: fibronectin/fibrinogen-binding protein [Ruminococcus sp.]|nr:fibronectin/fibrinogen-binding protein [Ruminococcus sp.]